MRRAWCGGSGTDHGHVVQAELKKLVSFPVLGIVGIDGVRWVTIVRSMLSDLVNGRLIE